MRRVASLLVLVLSVSAVLLLSACGGDSGSGGGGGGGSDTAGGGTDTIPPYIDGGSDDAGPGSPDAGPPDALAPDACVPACGDRACGDDGCAGSCGTCADGETCSADGRCEPPCVPDCALRFCGSDGCGGSCGTCADGEECTGLGRCQCVPQCDGRVCGDDGCDGACGHCPVGEACGADGQCIAPCIPQCADGCCGDDGCGGSCADRCTAIGLTCDAGSCSCGGDGPCGAPPLFPTCAALEPAPTESAAVTAFLEDYAVPLWCDPEGDAPVRDLTAFALDAADAGLFMFGEVHGSNELGVLSAALFSYLVRTGRVTTLAMELGVDLSDAMTEYVRTGGGPIVQQGWLSQLSPNMFVVTLLNAARALYLEGYDVPVFGADVPMIPGLALAVVEQLTGRLTETRAVVEPLPASQDGYWVDDDDARAWRARVLPRMDDICAELADEADCERFEQYTNAVWLSAFSASGALYEASEALAYEFFEQRERFIYYTYRTHMPTAAVTVYTHMGAAHTARASSAWGGYPSAATRLDADYPVTAGRVYSTTPAYGEGSRIQYGPEVYTLPAEPRSVATALSGAAVDEYFVSTWRPSDACVERPLLTLRMEDLGVRYADAYDAFTWVRALTPETGGWKAARSLPVRLFVERRAGLADARRRLAAER